jgi:hypothetical protein
MINPKYNDKIIISFCLYGNSDRYYLPLLSNLSYIKNYHSDKFKAVINLSEDYSNSKIKELKKFDCEIIMFKNDLSATEKRLFRLNPALLNLGAACFVRDSDSEFGKKDIALINDFMASSSQYQIIRDHPNHQMPILAGLWGIKRSSYMSIREIWSLAQRHRLFRTDAYRSDEIILADVFYPRTIKKTLVYSDFNIYFNEVKKRVSVNSIYSDKEINFLGRISPEHNSEDKNSIDIYINGKFRILLPYFFLKFFRYRFIFRINLFSKK